MTLDVCRNVIAEDRLQHHTLDQERRAERVQRGVGVFGVERGDGQHRSEPDASAAKGVAHASVAADAGAAQAAVARAAAARASVAAA